jgi:hypothetical protein
MEETLLLVIFDKTTIDRQITMASGNYFFNSAMSSFDLNMHTNYYCTVLS